jgi:drug/metabolite transporter (DMT)-like permease
MFGYAFLAAIEAIFIKYTLEIMSPIALYTIRIGILSFLFLVFAKPDLSKFKKKSWPLMILISIVVPIELMTLYTAIDRLGLVVANLIFLIGPVLILSISKFLFKENVTVKRALSNIVILICIAVAILIS